MKSYPIFSRRLQTGFTLVELILVVSLIGVLTMLALPSYREVMQRSHRTVAIAELMQVAACQEKTRAQHGQYDALLCLPDASTHYHYAYHEDSAAMFYQVEAHPLGRQTDDPCGSLALDSLGRRSVVAQDAQASRCWSGR